MVGSRGWWGQDGGRVGGGGGQGGKVMRVKG